jgi:SAM-dependent methyltransferase
VTSAVLGLAAAPAVEELFGAALLGERSELLGLGAGPVPLPVPSWLAAATDRDRAVLAHCRGATLDVGCGPGRMSAHLVERGLDVVGVDVVPEAVAEARRRGVPAWCADVLGPLPVQRRWDTVLLADGNIGIGGCPVTLLRRLVGLLGCGGRVVADLAPYGDGIRRRMLRLRAGGRTSAPFPWTFVGADAIGGVAAQAGLAVVERHDYAGRWCAVLEVAR